MKEIFRKGIRDNKVSITNQIEAKRILVYHLVKMDLQDNCNFFDDEFYKLRLG